MAKNVKRRKEPWEIYKRIRKPIPKPTMVEQKDRKRKKVRIYLNEDWEDWEDFDE